jgi:hypothetical protein
MAWLPNKDEIVKAIQNRLPEVKSIIQNVNGARTSVIFGDKTKALFRGDKHDLHFACFKSDSRHDGADIAFFGPFVINGYVVFFQNTADDTRCFVCRRMLDNAFLNRDESRI